MKSITEFANFNLSQGIKAKAALVAEGKTPEEIQTSLGETFKLEGDRLKHFINALEIAGQNQDGLKRVLVVSLNEGENAPAKGVKIEEAVYVPEFHVVINRNPPAAKGNERGGGGRGGRGGGRGGGPKSSPWGMTPEEKAAKGAKPAAAAKGGGDKAEKSDKKS